MPRMISLVLKNLMDTTKMKSVIIGAGSYGEVYLTYLKEAGVDVVGFFDDNVSLHGKFVCSVPVLGSSGLLEDARKLFGIESVYCPIGVNKLRSELLTKSRALGYVTPNFIHHSVEISSKVSFGEGVYILPGSIIMPYVDLANDVMISVGAKIIHHSRLGEGTFISNGVNLGASLSTGKYAYVGMGATIMTGVKRLGEDCMVGAGSVVIKDVPDKAVVAGVPAKILRYKD